jgi:DeoR family transcriptional regulator of aga operon
MRIRDYERHERILTLLKEETELDVEALARKFDISMSTARRDLTILDREGKLLRTFGGARAKCEPSMVVKTFGEKQTIMNRAKMQIARAATGLVKPGMKLTMDSGTTVWSVARLIKQVKPLTVISSSMSVIEEVGMTAGVKLVCAGGIFRPSNLDFYGPQAQAAFAQYAADIAFVGVDGFIPGRGAFSADQESAIMIRAISQYAAKRIVVADHTKIGLSGFILALENKKIDILITDSGVSAMHRRQLAKAPYKLIVAK